MNFVSAAPDKDTEYSLNSSDKEGSGLPREQIETSTDCVSGYESEPEKTPSEYFIFDLFS